MVECDHDQRLVRVAVQILGDDHAAPGVECLAAIARGLQCQAQIDMGSGKGGLQRDAVLVGGDCISHIAGALQQRAEIEERQMALRMPGIFRPLAVEIDRLFRLAVSLCRLGQSDQLLQG